MTFKSVDTVKDFTFILKTLPNIHILQKKRKDRDVSLHRQNKHSDLMFTVILRRSLKNIFK